MNSVTLWTAIGTIIALIVGGGTIIFQFLESRRARISRGIGILATLFDRWNGAPLIKNRRLAAQFLLSQGQDGQSEDGLVAVLNFFDSIGYMNRRGVLITEGIWNFFGTWILPYGKVTEKYIHDKQEEDRNLYCDFVYIFEKIGYMEKAKSGRANIDYVISEEAVANRLQVESELSD